jgi:hypothetical protein
VLFVTIDLPVWWAVYHNRPTCLVSCASQYTYPLDVLCLTVGLPVWWAEYPSWSCEHVSLPWWAPASWTQLPPAAPCSPLPRKTIQVHLCSNSKGRTVNSRGWQCQIPLTKFNGTILQTIRHNYGAGVGEILTLSSRSKGLTWPEFWCPVFSVTLGKFLHKLSCIPCDNGVPFYQNHH